VTILKLTAREERKKRALLIFQPQWTLGLENLEKSLFLNWAGKAGKRYLFQPNETGKPF